MNILKIFHVFYSYQISLKIKFLADKIYTLWLSNNIKKIGRTSVIGKDCFLSGGRYIEIGEHTHIGRHGVIICWNENIKEQKISPQIKIGNSCSIGEYCHITSSNSIIIGDGVLTGRRVTITDNSHGALLKDERDVMPSKRNIHSKGCVVIEDNVWIGDKVTILAKVRIGKGAIIAANSVVTKDVLEYTIVAGVPAMEVKKI
jgi:acetyltransferase-like isoleucine patch superfamily enzyme